MSNLKLKDNITENPRAVVDDKNESTALHLSNQSVRIDGKLEITDVPAGEHNTNQFLVLDGDKVKTRTGAQVLSDIGDEGGDIRGVTITTDDLNTATQSSGTASFAILGGEGIDTSTAGANITIAGEDASTSNKGVVQLIDEDDMSTDSDTRVPTQQSVKAYVDANSGGDVTLAGAQTFTGTKTFNSAFPQLNFTDDSSTDNVQVGLSGNQYYHKGSDDDINFIFRNQSNDDILMIDSGTKSVLVNDTSADSFNFKIGDNGRMNSPVRGFEMENNHGYFSPIGGFGLPYLLRATHQDLIRHQTPLTLERWNGSAYVDAISGTTSENSPTTNLTGLKNILDGERNTAWQLDDEWRKFRFVIERESTWADDQIIYLELTWSSITYGSGSSAGGSMCPTMTVEMLDGSFDASDDSNNDWTTHTPVTTDWHTTGISDQYGLLMYYKSSGMHSNDTHVRITVEFPDWDASAGGNDRMPIKNIGILSTYVSDRNTGPWTTDWDRNADGYGDVNIPTGHSYKINASSVLSATTLGSGVVNSSLTSVGTLSSLAVTGNLTVDTDTLFVDSSSNEVGINTTSPASALHVEEGDMRIDTASSGTQALRFSEANTTKGQLQYRSGDEELNLITVDASGTAQKRVTIKSEQDATAVGIGNDSPAQALDVTGNIAVSGTVDGRDLQTDGTKLDGIEAGATADQTKSDIDGLGITTVGTIDTGVWNGTAIANAYVADLPTSKITSGTFDDARISASSVTQHTPTFHWTRSTGGYFSANNTTRYTQSWEGDETWGNTVAITTALGGAQYVNYSDVLGGIWIAPADGKVTKSSIVVRNLSFADDLTIELWKINPADLRIYAINSVDITIPNTSSIVTSNTDLSSGNDIEENYVLFATMKKQATTGTSRHYFTWTISGTYD